MLVSQTSLHEETSDVAKYRLFPHANVFWDSFWQLLEEKSLAERKLCKHALISIACLTSKHLSGDGIRTSLSFLQSTSIIPMDLCSKMPTACSCSLLYFSSDSEKKLTSKYNTNIAAAGKNLLQQNSVYVKRDNFSLTTSRVDRPFFSVLSIHSLRASSHGAFMGTGVRGEGKGERAPRAGTCSQGISMSWSPYRVLPLWWPPSPDSHPGFSWEQGRGMRGRGRERPEPELAPRLYQYHGHHTVFFLSDGLQVQTFIFLVELAIRFKCVGIHPGRVKCR